MKLIQLVYKSTATSTNSDEFEDILHVARTKNAKKGITGMLMFHDKTFYQCIEGDESIINELYSKIYIDDRHFNVRLLGKIEIEKRSFSDWELGFINMYSKELSNQGFNDVNKSIDLIESNPKSLVKFMEYFIDQISLIKAS